MKAFTSSDETRFVMVEFRYTLLDEETVIVEEAKYSALELYGFTNVNVYCPAGSKTEPDQLISPYGVSIMTAPAELGFRVMLNAGCNGTDTDEFLVRFTEEIPAYDPSNEYMRYTPGLRELLVEFDTSVPFWNM
jgi:hypothetical protein